MATNYLVNKSGYDTATSFTYAGQTYTVDTDAFVNVVDAFVDDKNPRDVKVFSGDYGTTTRIVNNKVLDITTETLTMVPPNEPETTSWSAKSDTYADTSLTIKNLINNATINLTGHLITPAVTDDPATPEVETAAAVTNDVTFTNTSFTNNSTVNATYATINAGTGLNAEGANFNLTNARFNAAGSITNAGTFTLNNALFITGEDGFVENSGTFNITGGQVEATFSGNGTINLEGIEDNDPDTTYKVIGGHEIKRSGVDSKYEVNLAAGATTLLEETKIQAGTINVDRILKLQGKNKLEGDLVLNKTLYVEGIDNTIVSENTTGSSALVILRNGAELQNSTILGAKVKVEDTFNPKAEDEDVVLPHAATISGSGKYSTIIVRTKKDAGVVNSLTIENTDDASTDAAEKLTVDTQIYVGYTNQAGALILNNANVEAHNEAGNAKIVVYGANNSVSMTNSTVTADVISIGTGATFTLSGENTLKLGSVSGAGSFTITNGATLSNSTITSGGKFVIPTSEDDTVLSIKGENTMANATFALGDNGIIRFSSKGAKLSAKSITGGTIAISKDYDKTYDTYQVIKGTVNADLIKVATPLKNAGYDYFVLKDTGLYLTKNDNETLIVDSKYAAAAIGDVVDNAYIVGYNAFGTLADAINNIGTDTTTISVASSYVADPAVLEGNLTVKSGVTVQPISESATANVSIAFKPTVTTPDYADYGLLFEAGSTLASKVNITTVAGDAVDGVSAADAAWCATVYVNSNNGPASVTVNGNIKSAGHIYFRGAANVAGNLEVPRGTEAEDRLVLLRAGKANVAPVPNADPVNQKVTISRTGAPSADDAPQVQGAWVVLVSGDAEFKNTVIDVSGLGYDNYAAKNTTEYQATPTLTSTKSIWTIGNIDLARTKSSADPAEAKFVFDKSTVKTGNANLGSFITMDLKGSDVDFKGTVSNAGTINIVGSSETGTDRIHFNATELANANTGKVTVSGLRNNLVIGDLDGEIVVKAEGNKLTTLRGKDDNDQGFDTFIGDEGNDGTVTIVTGNSQSDLVYIYDTAKIEATIQINGKLSVGTTTITGNELTAGTINNGSEDKAGTFTIAAGSTLKGATVNNNNAGSTFTVDGTLDGVTVNGGAITTTTTAGFTFAGASALNGATITNTGATITVTNAATETLSVDTASTLKLKELSFANANSTLTINAPTTFTGTKMVIDLAVVDGQAKLANIQAGEGLALGYDKVGNDYYVAKMDPSVAGTIEVNAAWDGSAFGADVYATDETKKGKFYYGFNAFSTLADAINNIGTDTTTISVASSYVADPAVLEGNLTVKSGVTVQPISESATANVSIAFKPTVTTPDYADYGLLFEAGSTLASKVNITTVAGDAVDGVSAADAAWCATVYVNSNNGPASVTVNGNIKSAGHIYFRGAANVAGNLEVPHGTEAEDRLVLLRAGKANAADATANAKVIIGRAAGNTDTTAQVKGAWITLISGDAEFNNTVIDVSRLGYDNYSDNATEYKFKPTLTSNNTKWLINMIDLEETKSTTTPKNAAFIFNGKTVTVDTDVKLGKMIELSLNGADMTAVNVSNAGTISLSGNSELAATGTVTNVAGGVINVGKAGDAQKPELTAATITNAGTLNVIAGSTVSATSEISGYDTFVNKGTIDVDGSTVNARWIANVTATDSELIANSATINASIQNQTNRVVSLTKSTLGSTESWLHRSIENNGVFTLVDTTAYVAKIQNASSGRINIATTKDANAATLIDGASATITNNGVINVNQAAPTGKELSEDKAATQITAKSIDNKADGTINVAYATINSNIENAGTFTANGGAIESKEITNTNTGTFTMIGGSITGSTVAGIFDVSGAATLTLGEDGTAADKGKFLGTIKLTGDKEAGEGKILTTISNSTIYGTADSTSISVAADKYVSFSGTNKFLNTAISNAGTITVSDGSLTAASIAGAGTLVVKGQNAASFDDGNADTKDISTTIDLSVSGANVIGTYVTGSLADTVVIKVNGTAVTFDASGIGTATIGDVDYTISKMGGTGVSIMEKQTKATLTVDKAYTSTTPGFGFNKFNSFVAAVNAVTDDTESIVLNTNIETDTLPAAGVVKTFAKDATVGTTGKSVVIDKAAIASDLILSAAAGKTLTINSAITTKLVTGSPANTPLTNGNIVLNWFAGGAGEHKTAGGAIKVNADLTATDGQIQIYGNAFVNGKLEAGSLLWLANGRYAAAGTTEIPAAITLKDDVKAGGVVLLTSGKIDTASKVKGKSLVIGVYTSDDDASGVAATVTSGSSTVVGSTWTFDSSMLATGSLEDSLTLNGGSIKFEGTKTSGINYKKDNVEIYKDLNGDVLIENAKFTLNLNDGADLNAVKITNAGTINLTGIPAKTTADPVVPADLATLTASSITNTGKINAVSDAKIATTSFSNGTNATDTASLILGSGSTISATNSITNYAGSSISATDATIAVGNIVNLGSFEATGSDITASYIGANGNFSVTGGTLKVTGNGIKIWAGKTFTVSGDFTKTENNKVVSTLSISKLEGELTFKSAQIVDLTLADAGSSIKVTGEGNNFTGKNAFAAMTVDSGSTLGIDARAMTITSGPCLTVGGNFTNAGTITIDARGLAFGTLVSSLKVVAVGGDITSNAILVNNEGNVQKLMAIVKTDGEGQKGIYLVEDHDIPVDTKIIAVSSDWAGSALGETVTLDGVEYVFGRNAYAGLKDLSIASDTETIKITSGTYAGNLALTSTVKNLTVVGETAVIITDDDTTAAVAEGKFTVAAGENLTLTGSVKAATTEIAGSVSMVWSDTLNAGALTVAEGNSITIDVSDYAGAAQTVIATTGTTGTANFTVKGTHATDDFEKYFVTDANGAVSMNTAARNLITVKNTDEIKAAVGGVPTTAVPAGIPAYTWTVGTGDTAKTYYADNVVVEAGQITKNTYFMANPGQFIEIKTGTFTKPVAGGTKLVMPEDEYVKVVKNDINVTINPEKNTDATFTQHVIGGDVVSEQGIFIRKGKINLTINGGEFGSWDATAKQYVGNVAGGMYYTIQDVTSQVKLDGSTFLTITAGTFNSTVYGGSLSGHKTGSQSTVITGYANVRIEAGEKVIKMADLILGSSGSGSISKGTKLTLTGIGDNLEIGSIWGGCGSDYYTNDAKREYSTSMGADATRTLTFEGFKGTLNCGSIRGFSDVYVGADKAGVVATEAKLINTDKYGLADASNWTFEAGSSLNGEFANDFAGDTLALTGITAETKDWQLFNATGFTGADTLKVSFNGGALVDYNEVLGGWANGNDYMLSASNWTYGLQSELKKDAQAQLS